MPAPFAAAQARVNAAVMRRLANATAIVGEEEVPGIYERRTIIENGIEATRPTFELPSHEVAAKHIEVGGQLRIPQADEAVWGSQEWWGGTLFTVRGLQPDGTGLTLLILEAP